MKISPVLIDPSSLIWVKSPCAVRRVFRYCEISFSGSLSAAAAPATLSARAQAGKKVFKFSMLVASYFQVFVADRYREGCIDMR